MSHPEEYDVVVLGSGRARFFAWSLASQGKKPRSRSHEVEARPEIWGNERNPGCQVDFRDSSLNTTGDGPAILNTTGDGPAISRFALER